MRKNKRIEQHLYLYAESGKPEGITCEAKRYLENMPRETNLPPLPIAGVRRSRRKIWAVLSAVSASVMVFVLAIIGLSSILRDLGAGNTPPSPYSLESLTRTLVSEAKFKAEAGTFNLPDFGADSVDAQYALYTKGGETYAAQVKVKAFAGYGLEEMVILKDLAGGLSDYSSVKRNNTLGDSDYCGGEKYEGGEYYSEIYFTAGAKDYYLFLMSPAEGRGVFYADIVFGK